MWIEEGEICTLYLFLDGWFTHQRIIIMKLLQSINYWTPDGRFVYNGPISVARIKTAKYAKLNLSYNQLKKIFGEIWSQDYS